jgi:hypothetical protein
LRLVVPLKIINNEDNLCLLSSTFKASNGYLSSSHATSFSNSTTAFLCHI